MLHRKIDVHSSNNFLTLIVMDYFHCLPAQCFCIPLAYYTHIFKQKCTSQNAICHCSIFCYDSLLLMVLCTTTKYLFDNFAEINDGNIRLQVQQIKCSPPLWSFLKDYWLTCHQFKGRNGVLIWAKRPKIVLCTPNGSEKPEKDLDWDVRVGALQILSSIPNRVTFSFGGSWLGEMEEK